MDTMTALGWLGTALQVGGALWLACRPRRPPLAYIVMLFGSAAWLLVACRRGDLPLGAMMLAYCLINKWGILRWTRTR